MLHITYLEMGVEKEGEEGVEKKIEKGIEKGYKRK